MGLYVLLVANNVEGQHIAEDGLATFGYVANWHFIQSGQAYIQVVAGDASPLRHTWSLAIEEQFYLLWPLVVAGIGMFVLTRRRQRRGRANRRLRHVLAGVCSALAVLSLVQMVRLFFPGSDPNRVYYGTDSRAHLLLIGGALGAITAGSLAILRRTRRSVVVALGCLTAAALVGAMATTHTDSAWLYDGGYGAIAVGVALVLAAAAQPGFNPLARLLEVRPLVGLGLISYGVYLWHWPATVWITERGTGLDGVALFAVRAAATLVVSLASYVLVEQPIRRGGLQRIRVPVRGLVPASMATVVAVLFLVPALAFPTVAKAPRIKPSETSAAVTRTYGAAPRCDTSLTPQAPLRPDRAVRVFLAGNSIAEEVTECLGQILQANGATLVASASHAIAICDLVAPSEAAVAERSTQPDVGILFSTQLNRTACAQETSVAEGVHQVVEVWRKAGMRSFLSPFPAPALSVDPPGTLVPGILREVKRHPDEVSFVDAGIYIRDAAGVYQWRMPCLPGGEPGCAADGTIGVRHPDTGHFCSDGAWLGGPCAPEVAGGQRRVAAALAEAILEVLREQGIKPHRPDGASA